MTAVKDAHPAGRVTSFVEPREHAAVSGKVTRLIAISPFDRRKKWADAGMVAGYLHRMRPEPKKRLNTDAAQTRREGLNPAFSALNLAGLPNLPADPAPAQAALPVWKLGRVVLRRETARRGGKTVLVIHDFATHLPASVIETLAKKVRTACGCGGTVRERTIKIQGDQPGRIREVLEAEGFQVAGVR